MSITSSDFVNNIFTKSIDRVEALNHFENLSLAEKDQLIASLKNQMGSSSNHASQSGVSSGRALKAVDQRSLSSAHRSFIEQLCLDYERFVPKSKANVIEHQEYFVDQRRAFHLIKDLKRLHFQITYEKAEGAYVFDVDGNKYIDISGDMGVNIFGHKPSFIIDSVEKALNRGIPLAGYSEDIFQACRLFSKITGQERVLFTQSGTEAVMFAVRIARAATKKKKVVIFEGAYHGLSDAVTAMRGMQGESLPIAPGMLQEFSEQLIVLEYGNMSDLEVIESHSNEIAAVLVEPVQSRHPYIQPTEFLHELRSLTIEQNIALVFDEMITGFRVCPKGAQGKFNIVPDISTYGKIPGGGLPTGVIAGSKAFLDLVDGGTWNFDDESMPSSKRTGMAGTHSQNPLKIASVLAVLTEIDKRSSSNATCGQCDCFQQDLNQKTEFLASELNAFFTSLRLPIKIDCYGSLFRFRFLDSYWGVTEALFFILLRLRGVETSIQGNCFLTTAHSQQDINTVIDAVKHSINTLIEHNFFEESVEADVNFDALKIKSNAKPMAKPHKGGRTRIENTESNNADDQIQQLIQLIKADLVD